LSGSYPFSTGKRRNFKQHKYKKTIVIPSWRVTKEFSQGFSPGAFLLLEFSLLGSEAASVPEASVPRVKE
jgi:hypothetical protein